MKNYVPFKKELLKVVHKPWFQDIISFLCLISNSLDSATLSQN